VTTISFAIDKDAAETNSAVKAVGKASVQIATLRSKSAKWYRFDVKPNMPPLWPT